MIALSDPLASQRRLRVLISAFAASPLRGSEPAVGWNIPLRLARWHDVTVLCSSGIAGESYEQEIGQYVRQHGPIEGLQFHFVKPPLLSRLFQRENGTYPLRRRLYYTGYAAWQRAALKEAMALHRARPFDVVHHLSITGYREPGYLWHMPAPFIWGPVGGADDVPWAYFSLLGWSDRIFYTLRNAANAWQKYTARRPRRAAAAARHVFAIGSANRRMIDNWGCDAEELLETGTAPDPAASARHYDPAQPLRIVWSGVHIGRKALPILLHAIARVGSPKLQLVVLGDGPQNARWKTLADQLGISAQVRWTGRLPRPQALAQMAGAHVLAFTGVQEGSPHVVLEALSLGLPVICHDACGMGLAVDESCGLKIPLGDAPASIAGFAMAIQRLLADPPLVHTLSRGALLKAAELSWESIAHRIDTVYRHVASASPAVSLKVFA